MRNLKNTLLFLSLFTFVLFAQEERNVLVEVFTNSHCPLCPPAHNVIDDYLSGSNGNRISYLFFHMVYPYSDDPLYWESTEGSDARDNYYNPVHATPQGWFDGVHQGSTSVWEESLNKLVAVESPLQLILTGTRSTNQFNINAQITRTGDITDIDLAIYFVVAEDLFFDGRNSISNHKHVMRKMFPVPSGKSFSIALNETINIEQEIGLESNWDADSLSVIVFVQSTASKIVYQSETINYHDLVVSADENPGILPEEFSLFQNYPNPFNPTTTLSFVIGQRSFVSLKVFDILGNDIATLVNEEKPAGKFEVEFNTTSGIRHLVSGVYFYQLNAGEFIQIKKMILLK